MNLIPHAPSKQAPGNQCGMVLLLCLIFLTALTLLGLSASAETILQNQLTTNLQETERARQSASAALSWAEDWLIEQRGPALETCAERCGGLFVHVAGTLPVHPEFEDLSWWMDNGHEAGIDPLTDIRITAIGNNNINAPLWVIEAVHEIPPAASGAADLQVWYRILARGNGHTESGISVIESIVTRSWASIGGSDNPDEVTTSPCPGSEPTAECGRVAWRELR